jgi:hypothetical protein
LPASDIQSSPIDIPEREQPRAKRLAMQSVSPILIAALRAEKTIRVFSHISSAVAFIRLAAHSCKPSRQGLSAAIREDERQPFNGLLAAPPTSADEARSTSAVR